MVTGQAAGLCFEFAAKRSALADTEKQFQELVEQATHPSQRRQKFFRQAGEAQSQTVRQRQKKHGRENFRQRVKKWREEQGNKSAATALKQVVPSVGKKQTAKKLAAKKSKEQKKNSKTKASAKQKASLKDKPSAHRKQPRKAEEKQDKRALAAAAAKQAEETAAAEEGIAGRQARVVGESAPQSLQGAVVLCVMQKGEVQVRQQGQTYWVRKSDLCFDVRLPRHPARLDYAGMSASVATEARRAVPDVDFYDWGSLLTDSQVIAGIQEVAARLGQQPDVTVLTPAEVEVVSQQRALPEELVLAAQKPGRHMICACLHTLCCAERGRQPVRRGTMTPCPAPASQPTRSPGSCSSLFWRQQKQTAKVCRVPATSTSRRMGFLVGSGSCSIWKRAQAVVRRSSTGHETGESRRQAQQVGQVFADQRGC